MLVRFESLPASRWFADDLAAGFFDRMFNASWDVPGEALPALDVLEKANELVVVAELPGVKKEDVKVTLHDGVLTISGERKQTGVPENSRWHRNERATGKFSRSLRLPTALNTSAVSAELNNGILRIVVPKAEEARPREIKVN